MTGVSAQDFSGGEEQLGLFDKQGPTRTDKLNQALDKISSKYGSGVVTTADLVTNEVEDEVRERVRREIGAARPKRTS